MTPGVCPCCNQEIADGDALMVSLETNTASRGGRIVHMPSKIAEMTASLLQAYPGTARHARLMADLYGIEEPENGDQILKVVVYKTRLALKPLGVTVLNVIGVGWRLRMDEMPREEEAA